MIAGKFKYNKKIIENNKRFFEFASSSFVYDVTRASDRKNKAIIARLRAHLELTLF